MGELSILCLAALCLAAAVAQETTLSYIIEHELDQSDQYVELELSVQAEGRSMKKVISDAAGVIAGIQRIAKQYCLQSGRAKGDCEEAVQASKYEVQPKYHLVRKVPTFTLFILTQQLTIAIHNVRTMGKMIDQIVAQGEGMVTPQGEGMVTLNNFAWKAVEEKDAEIESVSQGLQQGRELCQKMGLSLVEILSVEELQAPQQEQQEQQRDQDLAEAQVELSIFKFKVKCGGAANKKKGKGK